MRTSFIRIRTVLKKAAVICLSLLMLLGAVSFGTAFFGVQTMAAGSASPLLTFVVPEAIYLAPNASSYSDSTSSAFKYYINNTSTGETEASATQTTGKIYYTFSGASSATCAAR